MYILRNTGKRIVFHVYYVLFGETSFCKDNKIVNFIILHTKQYIYFSLKQKEYQLFVILYILSSPKPKTQVSFSDQNLSVVRRRRRRCRRRRCCRKLFTFSTKLGTNHLWVTRFQVCSNEGLCLFQRVDYCENTLTNLKNLLLQNH